MNQETVKLNKKITPCNYIYDMSRCYDLFLSRNYHFNTIIYKITKFNIIPISQAASVLATCLLLSKSDNQGELQDV